MTGLASDNTILRVKLDETDDSKKIQVVKVLGRKKETLGGKYKVPVNQSYGVAYHCPKGGIGLALILNGNPDQATILALMHTDHRPKDLAEGEVKIYDHQGQYVFIKNGSIEINTSKPINITSTGDKVTIKGTEIILDGIVRLGSADATRAVSAHGTIDTGLFADDTNQLTKVYGI